MNLIIIILGTTIDWLETLAVANVNENSVIVYTLYKNRRISTPQIRPLISHSFCKSTQTHNIPISLE